jgi:hypothetical protein
MALLPVLARSRPATNPSAGRDARICQLNTTPLPALTCVRRDKSRPVDRIRRVTYYSKILTGYGTPPP